jgi:hypothetical protein
MFRLVAAIQLCDIGSLYWQKQQQNAPCSILKMSINGDSTDLGIADCVIKALRGFSHA